MQISSTILPEQRPGLRSRPVVMLVFWFVAGLVACSEPPGPEDEPCFRGLSDLSGDGLLTDVDCKLVGAGLTTRQLCMGDPGSWIENASCRGVKDGLAQFITGTAEFVHGMDFKGKPLFVIESGDGGWLWYDENGNDVPDISGEQSQAGIADSRVMAMEMLSSVNEPIVAFGSHLWRDRNLNGRVDGMELIALATFAGGEAVSGVAMSQYGGYVVAGISTLSNTSPQIIIWADSNQNWAVEPSEVASFPGGYLVGLDVSTSVHRIMFMDRMLQRKTWVTDDWVFAPSEVVDGGVGECVSRFKGSSAMYTCFDAQPRALYGIEGRVLRPHLESFGDIGFTYGSFSGMRTTATAQLRRQTPTMWIDIDGEGDFDHRETFAAVPPLRSDVGALINVEDSLLGHVEGHLVGLASVTDPAQPGATRIATQAIYRSDRIHFLGEACGPDDVCASDLVCRRSGEDDMARCTMAPPSPTRE